MKESGKLLHISELQRLFLLADGPLDSSVESASLPIGSHLCLELR